MNLQRSAKYAQKEALKLKKWPNGPMVITVTSQQDGSLLGLAV